MTLSPEQATRDIALRYPQSVAVFEALGIDYCCGGARTLGAACERANVPWENLAQRLQEATTGTAPAGVDWTRQPLTALCRHIVNEHHALVRRVTPEIERRMERVVTKHGHDRPEVVEIRDIFTALTNELALHMLKEERVLFPLIERLEAAASSEVAAIQAPIAQMASEHDDAGEQLARIRTLSNNFEAPAWACPTYRALYYGLAELEKDLHQHIHLENNVLFPRALKA